MFTIMRYTLKEAMRKKILLISLLTAAVFLGIYWAGVYNTAKELGGQNRVFAEMIYSQLLLFGFYFGGFIVSLLAVLSSVGLVSAEIESGTIQGVLTKPLRRSSVLLGKFFGQGIFLAVYALLFFLVIFYITRVATGMELTGNWQAMLLFALEPIVLLAVAMLGTVILSTVANGAVVFMLYAVAVIGGVIEQVGWFINNASMKYAGIAASLAMPSDALYRKIVHLVLPGGPGGFAHMGPFGSISEPSVWMLVYTLIYIALITSGAVWCFKRRDI